MEKYQNIIYMLKNIFVVDLGFPEDMAISLYKESLQSSGKLGDMKQELREAFSDKDVSWKEMLLNDDYEVLDFDTEEEAKEFVERVLWEPITNSKPEFK